MSARQDRSFVISAEDRDAIMGALLIGLDSFGEIERLTNSVNSAGTGDLTPLHPTGAPDTVGKFAHALRALHTAQPLDEVAA
jgi:hypothetical protein